MPWRWVETPAGEMCWQHVWFSEDGYYMSEQDLRKHAGYRWGDDLPPMVRRPKQKWCHVTEPVPRVTQLHWRLFKHKLIAAPCRIQSPVSFECDGREWKHFSQAPDDPLHGPPKGKP